MIPSGLGRLRGPRRPRVLALVDLVQDIDVMLPVLRAIQACGALDLDIRMSRWLEKESPRTPALLQTHGLAFRRVRRAQVAAGEAPGLAGISAVLTASESSHPAHRAGHALTLRAKAAGARTYTLQHGLENVGLMGFGAHAGELASDVIFCWFPQASTPSDLPRGTRDRLDHVGRPEPEGGWTPRAEPRFDLAVYENLHWDRYGEDDRQGFLAGLRAVAQARPELRIALRPHPAGGWSEGLRLEFAQFGNMTLLGGAEARRDLASTAQSPGLAARVITTPSTVALDAALAGRPVALAAEGGSIYRPLPQLRTTEDWLEFACSVNPMQGDLLEFRRRMLVEGGAADRIVGRMCRDLGAQTDVSPAQPR